MVIRRVESVPRRNYYTHALRPPVMHAPPIKPGTKCCSPVNGDCTELAVGWIFQPEGNIVPGSCYCLRHGKNIVDEHHHHNNIDFHLVFSTGARLLQQKPQCSCIIKLDTGNRQCELEKGHKGLHKAGKRLWKK